MEVEGMARRSNPLDRPPTAKHQYTSSAKVVWPDLRVSGPLYGAYSVDVRVVRWCSIKRRCVTEKSIGTGRPFVGP